MSDQIHIIKTGIPLEVAFIYLAIFAVVAVFLFIGIRSSKENWLKGILVVLSVVGLVGAAYLAYRIRILGLLPQCSGGGGCAVVERSSYSEFLGIHMSEYGIFGYLTILLASVFNKDIFRLATFGLATFGFAASLVLTYLELWQIHAICQWCVGSAVIMTCLFVVSAVRLYKFYGRDTAETEAELENT